MKTIQSDRQECIALSCAEWAKDLFQETLRLARDPLLRPAQSRPRDRKAGRDDGITMLMDGP